MWDKRSVEEGETEEGRLQKILGGQKKKRGVVSRLEDGSKKWIFGVDDMRIWERGGRGGGGRRRVLVSTLQFRDGQKGRGKRKREREVQFAAAFLH